MNMSEFLKWIGLVIAGILSFIQPIMGMIWIIIACIIFDLVTAVARDITKQHKTHPDYSILKLIRVIKSHKIRRSIIKFVFYILFLILIFGVEFCFFGAGTILLPKIVAGMIVFGELVSITANLDIVMGTTLFTRILNKIRKIFEKRVETVITDESEIKDEELE